jgi:hypothetical protein
MKNLIITLEFNRSRGGWCYYKAKGYGETYGDLNTGKVDYYDIMNVKSLSEEIHKFDEIHELNQKQIMDILKGIKAENITPKTVKINSYRDGNYIIQLNY